MLSLSNRMIDMKHAIVAATRSLIVGYAGTANYDHDSVHSFVLHGAPDLRGKDG
jgi:hypothetical protein